MEKNTEKYTLHHVVENMSDDPVAHLTDEEQEWLGILYSGKMVRSSLQRNQNFSPKEREMMMEFIEDIEWLKQRFDRFFHELLQEEVQGFVGKN